jgi:16S rRNA processing protein RimM
MKYVLIGKLVNTHGLKGEVRILSDFKYKDKVFIPGMKFYLGRRKEVVTVKTYRHHKNFEMITMEGYDDINQVERLKKLYVYIKKEDLHLDNGEYLDTDLINLDVLVDNEKIGVVTNVRDSGNNKFLVINSNDKESFVPLNKEFVKEINLDSKYIVIEPIKGMF